MAVLVLGGEAPEAELLCRVAQSSRVYAADGGAHACLRAGIRPEFVLGDGDSLDPKKLPEDWEFRFREDQYLTDFEKVLAELDGSAQRITVLGGLGGRLDHTWNNLLIAAQVDESVSLSFEDGVCRLYRVTSKTPLQLLASQTTVSLLPIGKVNGVTTSGLIWNLEDGALGTGAGISQSNRTTAEGPLQVSVTEGVLYVWVETPPGSRCDGGG